MATQETPHTPSTHRRLIYVGNFLSAHGFAPAPNEILVSHFRKSRPTTCLGTRRNKAAKMAQIIYGLLTARKHSIVIIDVFSSQAFWFAHTAGAIAAFRRIPFIAVLHGGNLPDRFQRAPATSRRFLQKASHIACPSEYLREAACRQLGLSPTVIRNPLVLNEYPFRLRPSCSPRLLWVRSLHSLYNPEMAIRLVARLLPPFPQTRLTMVGPDKENLRARLLQLARQEGVESRVEFTGKLDKADWIKRSTESDIFINTTHFDNTPVSVVEAMALGLPVVTTNVGGIPYLVNEDIGYLVPDADTSAMANAITRIVDYPGEAVQKTRAARHFVEADFDLSSVAKKWENLFAALP